MSDPTRAQLIEQLKITRQELVAANQRAAKNWMRADALEGALRKALRLVPAGADIRHIRRGADQAGVAL